MPQITEQEREQRIAIQKKLATLFQRLLEQYGDTPVVRLQIVNYTMGYMGASYGLHVEGD